MAFCTILYKYTTRAWFQQDDFPWLSLRLQVHSWQSFLHAMFAPMAQGTIRPLSERAFYMAFSTFFGFNSVPYRILVYVTQLGNIALLSAIAYRMTKSVAASFWAPVLWVANIALALPMTWTAAYNEVLWSFFFLLSFYALLLYIETGSARFHGLQWASFLLAFGVLETNVVYPVVATFYAALFAPRYVKKTWWLALPSLLFALVHTAVRTPARNDVYALHFDRSMLGTLGTYWQRVLGPSAAAESFAQVHFYPLVLTILLSVAIVGFALIEGLHGDRLPVFFLGWFAIVLAPFLPLRNHISDYYLTVPSIGLALFGAWAITVSMRRTALYRVLAGLAVAAYLICSVPTTRKLTKDIWARSMPVKRFVQAIMAVHRQNPDKTILIEGVDEGLFWTGVYDRPFHAMGFDDVYLTPDTVGRIPPYPELGNVADFTLPQAAVLSGVAQNRIVVYRVNGVQIRDITGEFKKAMVEGALPRRIEIGHPLMESLLGPSWYASEGDYRWMPKEAKVRIGAPLNGKGELRIEGFCAPIQVETKPLVVLVIIDGQKSAPTEIRDCNQPVKLTFPVNVSAGTKEVEITVVLDRTIRAPPDTRDLGLAIRSMEILSASLEPK